MGKIVSGTSVNISLTSQTHFRKKGVGENISHLGGDVGLMQGVWCWFQLKPWLLKRWMVGKELGELDIMAPETNVGG